MLETGSENEFPIFPLVHLPVACGGQKAWQWRLVMSRGRHRVGSRETLTRAAGFPVRRRLLAFGRALFVALLAAAGPLTAPSRALADDFERLLTDARAAGTLSVLVTGWYAVTGDGAAPQGSRGEGLVAITGDEFVRELEAASERVSVTRRYDNFPILAMEMDGAALRAAKAYGSGVEIWKEQTHHLQLRESVSMVGAPQAWREGLTGRGLAVAVIDSGSDTGHPFLAERTVFEACFARRCPNGKSEMIGPGAAFPIDTHGTHVAGIVLGSATDGLRGVGPELSLITINVFHRDSRGELTAQDSDILAGLDLVARIVSRYPGIVGAVNMSLGYRRRESGVCKVSIYDRAAEWFTRVGVPVVVASGNASDGTKPTVGVPACIEGFVSVGAVDKSGDVPRFSGSGPALDLLAPGVDIVSSIAERSASGLERGFQPNTGTSMAAPHVAAAMALLKQAAPESSVAELLSVLKRTGQPVRDRHSGVTVEMIDVGRSVEEMGSASAAPPLPPLPAELTLDQETAPPRNEEESEEEKEEQWISITG